MLMPFRYEGEDVSRCWCGGTLGSSRSPLVGECVECGTGVLRRRLTEASYERWYATSDYRRWVMGTDDVSAGQLAKETRRAFAVIDFHNGCACGMTGRSILDVGSGAGGMLLAASRLAPSAILGVDTDKRSQAIPESFSIPVITHMPPTHLRFERIICSHLIEHIVRPIAFLQMLAGYLDTDGCIYVETPAWGPKAEVKLPHPFMYTGESFRVLAKRVGLKVVAMDDGIRAVLRRA